MSEQENSRIAKMFFERLNRREIDAVPEYEHADMTTEAPDVAGSMTRDQYKEYLQGYLDAFPDLHFNLLQTIAQGNYVVVIWHASGTHSGPMRAPNGDMIPATNRKGVVEGNTLYEFRGGKIARTKNFWDVAGLLMQLGLMPQVSKSN